MTKSKISMAARGVASIFTLTAAILMGTNSQSIQVVDFIFTAKYTDWDSFRLLSFSLSYDRLLQCIRKCITRSRLYHIELILNNT